VACLPDLNSNQQNQNNKMHGHSVEFDCINEGGWMENEFTPEEVLEAIKNAAKNAAPAQPVTRHHSMHIYTVKSPSYLLKQ
jgi:hypothetical protein